jgi:hypothetical protein
MACRCVSAAGHPNPNLALNLLPNLDLDVTLFLWALPLLRPSFEF